MIDIIKENKIRIEKANANFNPVTGKGSILSRVKFSLTDYTIKEQYIPKEMAKVKLVRFLSRYGSIHQAIDAGLLNYKDEEGNTVVVPYSEENAKSVRNQLFRTRIQFDFAFWAAILAWIKRKGGGEDLLFQLNRPQRRLITYFEKKRLEGKPIRLILLKARQWGGSTAVQIYMAWLQLVHKEGLNSLIVGHVKDASTEVKDMFDKLINNYPLELLHDIGESYSEKEPKMIGVGQSTNIHRIPQRNCKIKIGTAEKPETARGGDYNLVHCTEVGLWKKTDGKTPEDIIDAATSGILYAPYTMIVYESTAKGVGNFFHREYVAAKRGESQFEPMFVSWYEIELYQLPFSSDDEKADFAVEVYNNRNNRNTNSDREEPGIYLWSLWEKGATLENIHWYVTERRKYHDHGHMASEYPSDDIEAFVNSGSKVFDKYNVEKLRKGCRIPKYIGDVYADVDSGKDALKNIRFKEDHQGLLWIWELPDIDPIEKIINRYLVVVDIGGRSGKADWSVITVFDRLYMADGDKPVVVAQWYGHIDMDILAWKSAQIAAFYDNALLVIESNTLETKDKDRDVDGDQSSFILNQIKDVYPNLYARKQSEEDIKQGNPRKYGFHTNVLTKPTIISWLQKVLRECLYVERDERCLDEYLNYEKKQNNSFGAVQGQHDDLLMTRAIGLYVAFREMELPKIIKCDKDGELFGKIEKFQKVVSIGVI